MQKAFLVIAIIGATSTVQAQQYQCNTPNYSPGPVCDTGPQCEWRTPPAAPPHAPPQQTPPQQTPPQQSPPSGYYAAPPQSGPMQGPSRAVEIEGAALRFPSLELKFPSLRLPSCSKVHTNARMLIEAAHAPYVQQPQVAIGSPIAIQQLPAPQQSPPQQSPPQQTPPHMPPHAPPDCNAPPRSPPHCDAAVMDLERQLRARDQKIEQLNQQMSRMAVTMERLTQVMDRLAVVSDETKNVPVNQMSFAPEPIREPAMQTIHTGVAQPLHDPRANTQVIREPGAIRLSNYMEPAQGAPGEPRRLR